MTDQIDEITGINYRSNQITYTSIRREMTRAESLDKAWRLAAKEKNFSLVDELYHAEYKSIGGVSGAELNLPALEEAF